MLKNITFSNLSDDEFETEDTEDSEKAYDVEVDEEEVEGKESDGTDPAVIYKTWSKMEPGTKLER